MARRPLWTLVLVYCLIFLVVILRAFSKWGVDAALWFAVVGLGFWPPVWAAGYILKIMILGGRVPYFWAGQRRPVLPPIAKQDPPRP